MSDDLVKRLRNTPNWMREGFQDWKDNVRTYDSAPFEAADRIEELEAKLAKAVEALVITDKWLRELDMYASPDYHLVPSLQQVRTTLAELKGEK